MKLYQVAKIFAAAAHKKGRHLNATFLHVKNLDPDNTTTT